MTVYFTHVTQSMWGKVGRESHQFYITYVLHIFIHFSLFSICIKHNSTAAEQKPSIFKSQHYVRVEMCVKILCKIKYYHAAEMFWYIHYSTDFRKHLFGTDPCKNHAIIILICFSMKMRKMLMLLSFPSIFQIIL